MLMNDANEECSKKREKIRLVSVTFMWINIIFYETILVKQQENLVYILFYSWGKKFLWGCPLGI